MNYHVEIASDLAEPLEIRRAVFIDEQKVPVELEIDGLDREATHFVVREGSLAVGTARLRIVGELCKFERIAVLQEHRGKGIGKAIVIYMIDYVRKNYPKHRCEMDAQIDALPFYEKLGFIAQGETFLDAGILHRKMIKSADS